MIEFTCQHCGTKIPHDENIGTKNRNHCPKCLYSLHVDNVPGDRRAICRGEMEPIGLTFKNEGRDKYGNVRQGELMLIHNCLKCGKISINRIAGDDDPKVILAIFDRSKNNKDLQLKLKKSGVLLLEESSKAEIEKQLFGSHHN